MPAVSPWPDASRQVRRCVIHVGHPKTASTYLQHCLHLNQDRFAAAGFWLPWDFNRLGFYDVRALSEQGRVISGNLAPLHEVMCNGPGTILEEMHDYLFVPRGMDPDSDVLLSSELFFYYVNATARIATVAFQRGLAPEIVAYLPRQDRAAISGYLQSVRYHDTAQGAVDFLLHDSNMPYFQYYETLTRLRRKLPHVKMTIRTFDPQFLVEGDVFADFLQVIGGGIEPAECRKPPQVSNQGLVLEHYELLRVASILGRADVAARLRSAEVTLTPGERRRLGGFYYRDGLHAFLNRYYLPANQHLLDEFMPEAGEAERDFWLAFDPPRERVTPDQALLGSLGRQMFGA